jgi:hypothetical protein
MEASIVIKLLSGLLGCTAALYVLLLRPWRPVRLLKGLVPSVDLLFCTGLALCAIALYEPRPFELGAELVVAQTDLPETLADLDERIDATLQLPQRTWESWSRWLGWEREDVAEPISTGGVPGRVATAVLPAVKGVVQTLLSAFAYGAGLILIAVGQAMRIVVGVRRAVGEHAARRAESLEARLRALEAELDTLQTSGCQ